MRIEDDYVEPSKNPTVDKARDDLRSVLVKIVEPSDFFTRHYEGQ